MSSIVLRALNDKAEVVDYPLPLDRPASRCTLRLRALPGASALYLMLLDGAEPRRRAELPVEDNEQVSIQVERDRSDALHLQSPGRTLLTLPPDSTFQPVPPLRLAADDLDMALVIDGTSRASLDATRQPESGSGAGSARLLENPELWRPVAEKLTAFIDTLSARLKSCRIAVLAFGDQPPAGITALDLIPRYQLYSPSDSGKPLLQPPDAVLHQLLAIPPSSGGDFVDALADALEGCVGLRWRPQARKVVLLSGDSPGYSILYPAPQGGDACVRRCDVDSQALELHRRGVELVTLYYDAAEVDRDAFSRQRELLHYARDQYRRLASLSELAWLASSFDPAAAAQTLLNQTGPIGRGAALGELLEIAAGE